MSVKKKRKLRSKMRLVVFIIVLLSLFGGGFVAANNLLWPLLTGEPLVSLGTDDDVEKFAQMPGINVLMMGVDERSDETSLRTDTMILANINNKENRVALLSIPRDTKVEIAGHGTEKINAANIYGGPELAMQKVSELTGVEVDYYVTTNFNGFKDIVDALGGVTIDVEKPMNYTERAYGGAYDIHLAQGVQELNGNQALMYARFRHDALGDITRTQRQLKLLKAIGSETMQASSITKLPKLVPQVYKNVDTNLGLSEMVALAKAAKNLENVQIVTQTMPGWFLDEHGASYWYVDPAKAKEVATALFEEGRVVEVVQGALTGDQKPPTQVAMQQTRPSEQAQVNTSRSYSSTTTENHMETYTPETYTPAAKEYTAGEEQPVEAGNEDITTYSASPDPTDQSEPTASDHVEVIVDTWP